MLLVDDEEVNRDVGQVYLDRLGCTFTCLEVRQWGWRVVVGAACVLLTRETCIRTAMKCVRH